jgi:hypothetical protein
VIQANVAKEKLIEDPDFVVGFANLVPEGDGILEKLNQDTPALVECFYSLFQESFPEEVPLIKMLKFSMSWVETLSTYKLMQHPRMSYESMSMVKREIWLVQQCIRYCWC